MGRLASALYSIAVAVWVGGMLAIGFIAAPVLFAQLADRTMAGNLAGEMFTITAWMGFACGAYLALYVLFAKGWRAIQSGVFWIVLLMLVLTAAGHFGVQPVLAQLYLSYLCRKPRFCPVMILTGRWTRGQKGFSPPLLIISNRNPLWIQLVLTHLRFT